MKSTYAMPCPTARWTVAMFRPRVVALASCLLLASTVIATPMSAPSDQASAKPAQAKPKPHQHQPVAEKLNTPLPASGLTPATKPHAPHIEEHIVDRHGVTAPHGPGPRSEGAKHGIIFVGGHAQNLLDHDKAALNPQPIPPGHALHSVTHPVAPIEKRIGH